MIIAWKELIILYITIAGFISYLPQIIRMIKTKSSEDISISSWLIWTMNSVLYLVYIQLSEVTIWLILSQVVEVVLIGLTTILVIIFRMKRNKRRSDN